MGPIFSRRRRKSLRCNALSPVCCDDLEVREVRTRGPAKGRVGDQKDPLEGRGLFWCGFVFVDRWWWGNRRAERLPKVLGRSVDFSEWFPLAFPGLLRLYCLFPDFPGVSRL